MRLILCVCVCILFAFGLTAAATALPMGDENATADNASNVTIVSENMTENQTGNMTVAEVIGEEQNLTMLATALDAANLTIPLQTGGPYTVFAPTDEAFQALGNETIDQLFSNQTELEQILLYHVVEGNYTAEQLMNMTGGNQTDDGDIFSFLSGLFGGDNQTENATELQTLGGENLTITQENGQVMVNNASVVQADLNASNGVVHIIDQVLIPQNATVTGQTNMTQNQTAGNETGMTA
ncbi:fasciclin domain-containing protein [Methanoculleus sp. FWC-SCC1]|uniref:Fasciclin domain-containing protein n=1 Tax=Methanoculleus frigidifontis TaxID=2584085 RepID=A0ABT8M5U5_9EURY|nr:fasciclin domain-containing protein [Methanoculleus sp. FWC-SCC1]MDN7023310.1 fasciclin domain-containing protein [Methanoculleus sp. FWC-SCC1]